MGTSTPPAETAFRFSPTGEQLEFRALARDFATRELRPAAASSDRTGAIPDGLLKRATEAGLTSYGIPVEYGGGGLDPVTCAIVAEELAWGDSGLSAALGSGHLFAGGLLAAEGERAEALRQEFLPRFAQAPGAYGAIAFSEPQAGSDFAAIQTRAERDGEHWVIRGEKTWITAGAIANAILVFARTSDDGASGISCFVVDGGARGMSTQRLDTVALKPSATASLFFDDVLVPHERLLGEPGDGFAIAMRFFMKSRPQIGANAVGVARAAFEYAAAYANERTAFGKPIAANQGISFLLADMGMRIEAARALVWRAADAVSRGVDAGLVGSYAKAFASDVAMQVCTDAVQVLGGAGLVNDHPVERWMRDAKVLQIVEGTNQIQRLICSRYYRAGVTAVD